MKKYFNWLVVFVSLLFFSPLTFAEKCLSSETISVKEIETLITARQYDEAKVKLQKVVADCPSSLKAHKYLTKVSALTGDTALSVNQKEAVEKIETERRNHAMRVAVAVIFVLVLCFGAFWWYLKYQEEEAAQKRIDEETQKRYDIYGEVMSQRGRLDEAILYMEAQGHTDASSSTLQRLHKLHSTGVELIEVCVKDIDDLNINAATNYLRDVERVLGEIQ